MNARLVAILRVGANLRVWLLSLAWLSCTLAASFGPTIAEAPQLQDPLAKAFRHVDHVPKAWARSGTEEYWRDCRGCHQFDGKNLVSAPQLHCVSCHVPSAAGATLVPKAEAGWEKDLAKYRTPTRDAFRHHTHGMLQCRECHLPADDDFRVAEPWLNSGPGQCVRCHDPTRVTAETVATLQWFAGARDQQVAAALEMPFYEVPADPAALAKRLVDVFAPAGAGINLPALPPGGDFDHGDHLGLECAACHTDIKTATAKQVGTGEIPTDGCKQCHFRDAAGTALRRGPGAAPQVRELASLGAFAHGDHYRWLPPGGSKKQGAQRVCSDEAYTVLEQGCKACHLYRPTIPGRGEPNFPFGTPQSRETYSSCIGCHSVPGWQTGETKERPLHESTGAALVAASSHWTACTQCHDFAQPDLGKVRPMDAVARARERTFVFPANTHPDITRIGTERATAAGRPAAQDCKECHRRTVPQLSSRLREQTFTHASHLPANATAATCLECHPSAGTAPDATALGGTEQRTYTLQSCGKCHWGGAVTEAEGPAPAMSNVVRFPHGPHVTAAKQACSECHEVARDARDGRDITTKATALACTQCHDHKQAGKAELLFGDQVTSCARCHHDPAAVAGPRAIASVPPIRGSAAAKVDSRYRTEQSAFSGFIDSQFHPLGVACADCHKANDLKPQPLLSQPPEVHIKGVRPAKSSVHADGGFSTPADCLRCHWRPAGQSWTSAVSGSTGDEGDKALRRAPEDKATRSAFGNLKQGYPGTPSAKG